MRLTEPRIEPLPESQWSDEAREQLDRLRRGDRVYNIFATLAHHPKLLKRWLVFGNHIMAKSTLSARHREIAILRVAWLCRAEYEWGHHVAIAKAAGLSDQDIRHIIEGPDAAEGDPFEAMLLRAADELNTNTSLSSSTWSALAAHYSTEQLLDLIFTVGEYKLVSMALNSLGVQLEEGFEGLPQ